MRHIGRRALCQFLTSRTYPKVLFQIYLTTFGYGINFLTSLVGYQQNPMMLNPIFESSSPSDFWGRRYEMVISWYNSYYLTSNLILTCNPTILVPSLMFNATRRWNLTVHGILKRGVYKPFRTRYSRLTASAATFMASGLFHEWLLSSELYFRPSCARFLIFYLADICPAQLYSIRISTMAHVRHYATSPATVVTRSSFYGMQ